MEDHNPDYRAWRKRGAIFLIGVVATAFVVAVYGSRSDYDEAFEVHASGAEELFEQAFNSRVTFSKMSEFDHSALFETYLKKYKKPYSKEEKTNRFKIFRENLLKIDKKNQDEQESGGSAVYGMTKFIDMSEEEFRGVFLKARSTKHRNFKHAKPSKYSEAYKSSSVGNNGDSSSKEGAKADWTDIYTTKIQNQGSCGSCWAFSTASQVESDAIRLKLLDRDQPLSKQQLVSCDFTDYGCGGGTTENGFNYVKNYGLALASEYPYTEVDVSHDDMYAAASCSNTRTGPTQSKIAVSEVYTVPNEDAMVEHVLHNGPLSICVDASSWIYYKSGVIHKCGQDIDHCVQVVGVSTKEGYWKVRNSWGTDWGEDGFIYLRLGENTCGISSDPQYTNPVLVRHNRKVTVSIKNANDLLNQAWSSPSKVYAVASLGYEQFTTETSELTSKPTWNQDFEFKSWDGVAPMTIQLFDAGTELAHYPLGYISLNLLTGQFPDNEKIDIKRQLESLSGVLSMSVHVSPKFH